MSGELVIVTKNGNIGVLVPLYMRQKEEPLDKIDGFSIFISTVLDEPAGYLLDWEPSGEHAKFFNCKILKMVEVIGEL